MAHLEGREAPDREVLLEGPEAYERRYAAEKENGRLKDHVEGEVGDQKSPQVRPHRPVLHHRTDDREGGDRVSDHGRRCEASSSGSSSRELRRRDARQGRRAPHLFAPPPWGRSPASRTNAATAPRTMFKKISFAIPVFGEFGNPAVTEGGARRRAGQREREGEERTRCGGVVAVGDWEPPS